MATSVDELERRVTTLEQEMELMRRLVQPAPKCESPAEAAARMLRESKQAHGQLVAAWEKAMEQMGVRGEPIPAEQLQEMMRASGINPEGTEISRGIVEMREE